MMDPKMPEVRHATISDVDPFQEMHSPKGECNEAGEAIMLYFHLITQVSIV